MTKESEKRQLTRKIVRVAIFRNTRMDAIWIVLLIFSVLITNASYVILKCINYSWEQQPINEAYLGHMHEPWYPAINTQMKILWVLIWHQTWLWSQIKHLHFNDHFSIINTSLTTIPKMIWIFNNYSPKAKLILLNNLRDEVEGIIQQC